MLQRILVFYVLTWFFLILLGGAQQATGFLPPEVALAQWGPGIAGLLMLVIFRKDNHKLVFISRNTSEFSYLFAALIPAGVALAVLGISSFMKIRPSIDPPVYSSLWSLMWWMPFGALGEEIGWRGYLHKMLNPRMHGLVSSILVGILWMPIHITFLGRGLAIIFLLTVLLISYSIVLYALVQDSEFNILLASLFHLVINLVNLLFLDVIYETSFMLVNASAWAVTAFVVIWVKRTVFFGSSD